MSANKPSKPAVLLVAGPATLTDHAEPSAATRWWSGSGFYAAAASAAITPTQLWARVPSDLRDDERQLIQRRRIDDAGCDHEATPADATLPSVEPVDATDLGACLSIGLHGDELMRARRVIAALPEAKRRCEVVALAANATLADLEASRGATLLIAGLHQIQTLLNTAEPTAVLDQLLEHDHQAVLLTAGPLGGIGGYKAKRWAWPAVPISPAAAPSDCPDRARATFTGVIAGQSARLGHLDWRHLKRWVAEASAVAATAIRRPGPKGLMQLDSSAYSQAFVTLRRTTKY